MRRRKAERKFQICRKHLVEDTDIEDADIERPEAFPEDKSVVILGSAREQDAEQSAGKRNVWQACVEHKRNLLL
jgi:hypothetical protein